MTQLDVKAPGPGTWELDDSHFDRPMTTFMAGSMAKGFVSGMKEAFARYGVLLDHVAWETIDGFCYLQMRPVGAPPGASGTPPKPVFWLLSRLHPEMRRRHRASVNAFETKLWREDVARWDQEIRPGFARRLGALEDEDPATLDEGALAQHVATARTLLDDVWHAHFSTNGATCVPVGDFVVHASDWTGLPPAEVSTPLVGDSDIAHEGERALTELAGMLRPSAAAQQRLRDADPAEELVRLRDLDDAVGEAARAWLRFVWNRNVVVGDLDTYNGGEVPHLLAEQLRVAIESPPPARAPREDKIRPQVPQAHRDAYDEKLAEARLTYRLRDERCAWLDSWACGLMRRALLAAGDALLRRGALERRDDVLEGSPDEVEGLLAGGPGPDGATLRARAERRAGATYSDVPRTLGPPPSPPPPAEWLPPRARRMQRAMMTYVDEMQGVVDEVGTEHVRGIPASPGQHLGTARVVNSVERFGEVRRGDVLIARATMPTYNALLPLLGGIVTDRGGSLSHAAIVSREFGIPGVVGCRDATARIPDGATVFVDGARGVVEVRS